MLLTEAELIAALRDPLKSISFCSKEDHEEKHSDYRLCNWNGSSGVASSSSSVGSDTHPRLSSQR